MEVPTSISRIDGIIAFPLNSPEQLNDLAGSIGLPAHSIEAIQEKYSSLSIEAVTTIFEVSGSRHLISSIRHWRIF